MDRMRLMGGGPSLNVSAGQKGRYMSTRARLLAKNILILVIFFFKQSNTHQKKKRERQNIKAFRAWFTEFQPLLLRRKGSIDQFCFSFWRKFGVLKMNFTENPHPLFWFFGKACWYTSFFGRERVLWVRGGAGGLSQKGKSKYGTQGINPVFCVLEE